MLEDEICAGKRKMGFLKASVICVLENRWKVCTMIRYSGTDSRYFLGMDTSVKSEYLILEEGWITNKNKFLIFWVF